MNGTPEANFDRVDARIAANAERTEALARILDERDRRYTDLRAADAVALNAALASAEKAVAAALSAAEKATDKAENNDTHYRAQQNEWRSSLSDILAKSVPMDQYTAAHTALIEKINDQNRAQAAALIAATDAIAAKSDARYVQLQAEIAGLAKSRDTSTGRTIGLNAGWGYLVAVIMALVAVLAIGIAVYFGIRNRPASPVCSTVTGVITCK